MAARKRSRRKRASAVGRTVQSSVTELKKSLETAAKIGAKYALIAGENELSTGVFALKDLATRKQESVPRPDLVARIRSVSEEK